MVEVAERARKLSANPPSLQVFVKSNCILLFYFLFLERKLCVFVGLCMRTESSESELVLLHRFRTIPHPVVSGYFNLSMSPSIQ